MKFVKIEIVTALIACSSCTAAEEQNSDKTKDLDAMSDNNKIPYSSVIEKLKKDMKFANEPIVKKVEEELNLFVLNIQEQYTKLEDQYRISLWDLFTKISSHKANAAAAANALTNEVFNKLISKEQSDEYKRIMGEIKRPEDRFNILKDLKLEAFCKLVAMSAKDDFVEKYKILVDNFKKDISTKFKIFEDICIKSGEIIRELEALNVKIFEETAYAKHAKKLAMSGDDRIEEITVVKLEKEPTVENYEDAGNLKEFLENAERYITQVIDKYRDVSKIIDDSYFKRLDKCNKLKVEIAILPESERAAYETEVKEIKESIEVKKHEYYELDTEVTHMKYDRKDIAKYLKQDLTEKTSCKVLFQNVEKSIERAKKILTIVTEVENLLAGTDSELENMLNAINERIDDIRKREIEQAQRNAPILNFFQCDSSYRGDKQSHRNINTQHHVDIGYSVPTGREDDLQKNAAGQPVKQNHENIKIQHKVDLENSVINRKQDSSHNDPTAKIPKESSRNIELQPQVDIDLNNRAMKGDDSTGKTAEENIEEIQIPGNEAFGRNNRIEKEDDSHVDLTDKTPKGNIENDNSPRADESSSSRNLWILLGVGVVIVIGAIIIYVFTGKKASVSSI
ncbi:hypothetical protein ENBRE01_2271 [Enteropsectra breve]|nr:hypothetical protein ENBRE01_2271 [Enteropsectra breve]